MSEGHTSLDPERQQQAHEFARIRRRLWAFNLILDGVYLALWVVLGWAVDLRQALAAGSFISISLMDTPWWIELALIAFIIGGPWFLIGLPLNFYSGFILPHHYGLSTQSLRGWLSDLLKGGLISLSLGLPLLIALYAVIRLDPPLWWLWAASGFTFFSAVLSALAPILLMPIFYKFRPLEEEHADLADRLVDLARKASTQVQGVFTFDMSRRTRAANAALVGLGRTRRIVLGDTLLSEFTSEEIETILAHELAHHVHRDIPLSLAAQTFFNFIAFYLTAKGLELAVSRLALNGPADPSGLPILALLFGLLSLLTMPLANAFSRWRETMADEYALKVTNKPQAFSSAMTRLANQNLSEVDPERWVVLLLHSHPPLNSRIEKAKQYSRQTSHN
jgi:STE24 endopeptidase